jgi:hypothetical protein
VKEVEVQELVIINPSFSMRIDNYCKEKSKTFGNFFIINPHLSFFASGLKIDTDGDGIHDKKEKEIAFFYNINEESKDSNGDKYSDIVVYRGGYTREAQAQFPPCPTDLDSDKDGLNDCEEKMIGTNFDKVDTDGDGIPDALEIFSGLNPTLPDAHIDTDKDGDLNLFEIASGTPIRESNEIGNIKDFKITYEKELNDNLNDHCQKILVKNIPLIETNFEQKIDLYFLATNEGELELEIYRKSLSGIIADTILVIDYEELKNKEQEN